MDTGSLNFVDKLPNDVTEIEHIWISMPDGVRLSARIWMPKDATAHPVPAILEYIPYRKRDGTRVRDDCRHRYWAGHGYACIRLDIRGTGDSEGLITDEYPTSEQDDAIAAISWIAAQPWCSGRIGMTGISWGGFNALQVAARRPPALKAIITHCSTDDRYADDVHRMGGCLLTDGFFWGSGFYHFMTRPPDPEIAGETWREQWFERLENWKPPASHIWMRHQRRDDYWRHGSVCESYGDIDCAVYAVGGWEDGYSNAVPRLLANLSCPSKGLVGPWGHKYPELGIPGPSIGFLQHALRWWDHWLKDEATGIMDEPAYTVWMQDYIEPGACRDFVPGRWISEATWPSPDIQTRVFALNADGLGSEAGTETVLAHCSPQSLGVTGGSWCPYGLGGTSPDLAIDQREDDGRSLCFETGPLTDAMALLGAPMARLRIAVDQPQGNLILRLMNVAPDGTAKRVTYGILNLTHRADHEAISPMTPGEWTEVTIQLNDLAHCVPAGHRLRLALSTAYWPMIWPAAAPVELSVMAVRSVLELPVRPAKDADADPPIFEHPEMAPPASTRTILPASSARTVERDLATGVWTQRLVEDGGRYHIDDIDLDVADGMSCTYSICESDPLSADAVWSWHSARQRENWHVEIESTTRLRATATEFLVDTDVDAREDGKTVFSRSWRERIPRDGV
ncbi:MAG TPA: CocE/NonD family hydrolase [Thermohalobaculum sp.]|nr:CocE/NonD family hydrolase [Thermohalobaculum sp.]